MGPKLKSGLAPTGVLRRMPIVHNSSQLLNIRPAVIKDKRSGVDPRSGLLVLILYSALCYELSGQASLICVLSASAARWDDINSCSRLAAERRDIREEEVDRLVHAVRARKRQR